MSPTECFKNRDNPFRRGGEKKIKGERKQVDVVESLNLPRRPHEQLAHLGAPGVGATATTASWSPFPMEMKTPWWWATSMHGVEVGMSTAREAPPASNSCQQQESKPSTRTLAPEPGPGGPRSGSGISEQPS